MERYLDINNDNTLTSDLRSRIKLVGKFIGKLYRINSLHSPSKTNLVLLLVIWMMGLLSLGLYTNFFKAPLTSENSYLYPLVVCSAITVTKTFIAYIRNRRK